MAYLVLPARDTEQLGKAPLDLVVCQVRFQSVELAPEAVFAFHAEIKSRLPNLQPAERQTAEITVAPQPVVNARRETGWQMTASDGSWAATLMPDSLALQTTKHTTWTSDFQPLLGQLIEALANHIKPSVELRVGIRYVDRLKTPAEEKQEPTWSGRIRDEVLGIMAHPVLGPAVVSSLQQLEIEVAENRGCTLRHGLFKDPAVEQTSTYFIDTDAFHLEARPFVSQQIMQTVNELHEVAVSVFQQMITPGYLADLKQK